MAFGNLKFDTLTTSDSANTSTEKSLDTSYIFNGSAKAWASITGDSFTLSDNFNVSSMTDNATGRPEANFTNNMANATFCAIGSSGDNSTTFNVCSDVGEQTTAVFDIRCVNDAANSTIDVPDTVGAVHGDLA